MARFYYKDVWNSYSASCNVKYAGIFHAASIFSICLSQSVIWSCRKSYCLNACCNANVWSALLLDYKALAISSLLFSQLPCRRLANISGFASPAQMALIICSPIWKSTKIDLLSPCDFSHKWTWQVGGRSQPHFQPMALTLGHYFSGNMNLS